MAQRKHNEVDFITEFINIYKEHTALWKIKSPEYSNRLLKDKGYAALIDLYKRHNIEPVTKDVIKKKISSLRSSFRREFKKIKHVKTGTGGEEAEENEPSLWYYNYLLFTADQEETRENISNDNNNEDDVQDNSEDRPLKRKANVSNCEQNKDKILKKALETLANDDEYDAYAVTVAAKLRKLSEVQRLYCENIINTALFEAALNQLTEHTTLTSPPQQYTLKPPPKTFNISSIISSQANSCPKSFIPLSAFDQPPSNQTHPQRYDTARTDYISSPKSHTSPQYKPPQSQNHDSSQFQNYGSPQSQTFDPPQSENYDSSQSQTFDPPQSQNYRSPQSQNCDPIQSPTFDPPQSQNYGSLQSQNYDSSQLQRYDNAKQLINSFNPQE